MKLTLKGHDYKYAVEQMMLTLFPEEKPNYGPPGPGEPEAVVSLFEGPKQLTATARVTVGGKVFRGQCRMKADGHTDELTHKRARQRVLKLAFYRAGVAALGKEPPWGALTGVRPVKLPTRDLREGAAEAQALRRLTTEYRVAPMRARLALDCAKASLAADSLLDERDISLYIGIPFCPSRCTYCSFVSADVGRALGLVEPFLDALLAEIDHAGQLLRDRGLSIRSIYIGGGTPTTLTAEQLDRLMGAIHEKLDLSRNLEYTVEAGRPDTITWEKLAVIQKWGADRVSVNPQSMNDAALRAMGRPHTAGDILAAYDLARQVGFKGVNMDLIAGLPADDVDSFRASLDTVLSLDPENITVHTLALKKGSTLLGDGGARPCLLPDAEQVAQMLDYGWKALADKGYRPYYLYRQKFMSGSFENVGWCKPGFESLYNICMMEELHSVLALGGGGVTKLVDRATGQIARYANPKYPKEYIEKVQSCMDLRSGLDWPAGGPCCKPGKEDPSHV